MEPTLHVGERVKIRGFEPAALRAGDVVLFEGAEEGVYILHRIALLVPASPWFFHIGDAPTPAGPRRAHRCRIVGRAEMPRRLPPPGVYLQLARNLARGSARRLRIRPR